MDSLSKIEIDEKTEYEDIDGDYDKQNFEKIVAVDLMKAISNGSPDWCVIIGESFFVRPRKASQHAIFKVGPLHLFIFHIIRSN